MTALVLGWRKPDPLLGLRWRGPDDSVVAAAQANPAAPIATIIGPPGSSGSGGSGYYLDHFQSAAQATWVIPHNFGRRPSVNVFDSGGEEVFATVAHLDINVVQIDFSVAVSGRAILTA